MEAISLDKVKCNIALKQILEIRLDASMNEHAVLNLKAVPEDSDENVMRKLDGQELILSYMEDGEETILFAGVVTGCLLDVEAEYCCIDITCLSASVRFDQEKRFRSFQDTSLTYGQVLRLMSDRNHSIVAIRGNHTHAKCPMIQYEESDWDLMKRIAGYLHTVVIPDIVSLHPQAAIGIIEGKSHQLEENRTYRILFHFDEYRKKNNYQSCINNHFVSYHLEGCEDYGLGDKIKFQGNELVVAKKYMALNEGLLKFQYELGREELFALPPVNNQKLCGMTLPGIVLDIRQEKLKVQLDIDKFNKTGQETEYQYYYDYVPATGNLLYSMPEKGARVSVYFPSADESKGMVTEAVREEVEYPDERRKLFETKHRKKIQIDMHQIKYSSQRERQYIQLLDEMGIGVSADKSIQISAKKRLMIQSNGQVESKARTGYHLEDTTSKDSMDISGTEITMTTDRAVTGGAPHQLGHKPVIPRTEAGMDPQGTMGLSLLGGIPQGAAGGVQGAMMAGIPTYGSPAKEQDIFSFISISRRC